MMYKITFEYCDAYSNGEWKKQTCIMDSVEQCIKVYGLGIDCDYRILSVKKVD